MLNSRHDAERYAQELKKRSISSQIGKAREKGSLSETDTGANSGNAANVFLKPHKEHLYRFLSDEQKEDNNLRALKRYENQLMQEK